MGRAHNHPADAFDDVLGRRRGARRPEDQAVKRLNPDMVRARLEQSEQWRARDGQVWRVDEMRPVHARRVLRLLRAQAAELHAAQCRHLLAHASAFDADGPYSPQADALDQQEPAQWLESTPLVRALKARS